VTEREIFFLPWTTPHANVRDGGIYSLHMDDPFGYDVQISGLENNTLTDG
jgi:hypothetical protein